MSLFQGLIPKEEKKDIAVDETAVEQKQAPKKALGFLAKKSNKEQVGKDLENQDHHYNPLKIPCDWKFAETHAKARATAPEKAAEGGHVQKTCDCCGYEIERETIDWKKDGVQCLEYLGSGFPMFYMFIKYCIGILLTLFIVEGIIMTMTNLEGNFCETAQDDISPEEWKEGKACVNDWILILSTANIKDDPELHESRIWYSYLTIILVMIILVFFRKTQKTINNEVDGDMKTAGDFSILVKNIPKNVGISNFDYRKELKEKFSKATEASRNGTEELIVKKVTLVYDLEKLEHKEEEVKELIKEKQDYLIKNGYEETNEGCINDKEIKEIDEKIHHCHHAIEEMNKNLDHPFAGIAFVTYNTKIMKQKVIEENELSSWYRTKAYFRDGKSELKHAKNLPHLYFHDRHIYVESAPEPNEIDWEFMHLHTTDRIMARIKCNLMQFGLCVLCFVVIWLLSYWKSSLIDKAFDLTLQGLPGSEETYVEAWTIAYFIAAFIIAFNKFCLGFLCHQICDREKWSTKTKMNISFATKLTISLFLNTAIITFAVEILTFNNYYGVGGMMFTEYIIFILNGIVPPFAFIFDPWSHLKNYKREKERKKTRSVFTQEQANIIMEHEAYTMGKRYADIMKTMWFTFMYAPALPMATPFSIMGLSIYYFADKYNVMHRRTIKESIGAALSIEMIELLEYIILLHTFGNFWFTLFLFHYVSWGSVILFVVGLIYITIPMQEISDWIFGIKEVEETDLWDDVEADLDTDYDRENPVLKEEALLRWQKIRDQKEIDVLKKEQLEKNMKKSSLLGGAIGSLIK